MKQAVVVLILIGCGQDDFVRCRERSRRWALSSPTLRAEIEHITRNTPLPRSAVRISVACEEPWLDSSDYLIFRCNRDEAIEFAESATGTAVEDWPTDLSTSNYFRNDLRDTGLPWNPQSIKDGCFFETQGERPFIAIDWDGTLLYVRR